MKRYSISIDHKATTVNQLILTREFPEGSWQESATDFFTFDNKEYLPIGNTFSKYPFIFKITSKTSEVTQSKFTQIFSQCGQPKRLFTDSSLPFVSEALTQLMTAYILHITLSPLYSKSNNFSNDIT